MKICHETNRHVRQKSDKVEEKQKKRKEKRKRRQAREREGIKARSFGWEIKEKEIWTE